MDRYRFQLLRYTPNRLSEEFYNLALFLYSKEGRLVDARFAPDFVRLRCNPLADIPFLHRLKEEFENRRLAGEQFSSYVEDLKQHLSQGLQLSEEKSFLGEDAVEEIERLSRIFLATPRRSEIRRVEAAPGTRRWILGRLRATFRVYHLLDRLVSDVAVGEYVSPRYSFRMDYAYRPNGEVRYVHALSSQHDLSDAGRLCFVFDRIRSRASAALTAVIHDSTPGDTRKMLEESLIRPWNVSRLDELAAGIRSEMGL